MRLSDHQALFTSDTAQLIEYANSLPGCRVRLREVSRPSILQKLYIKLGKSWTMNSWHMDSLAVDMILDINGQWQSDTESYRKLGIFWESLSSYNRWGGRFSDGNHFERRTFIRELEPLELVA